MLKTWYCPGCRHHSDERFGRCPDCGHSLAIYESDSYAEKLMRAPSHPVREQRMIAIETLGKLHYIPAIPEFERLIRARKMHMSYGR